MMDYSLAAVNFCLACVGTIQVSRVLIYQRQQKGTATAALKEVSRQEADAAKGVEVEAKKELA